MLACQNNNVKIVELLLNNHANINIQSQYGDTAFSWACYNGNLDIAELLLKNDASVNAKGKSGNTPLISILSSMIFILFEYTKNI